MPVSVLRQLLDAVVERDAARSRLAIDAERYAAEVDACRVGWSACEAEPAVSVERRGWPAGAVVALAVIVAGSAVVGGYLLGRAN